MTKNGLLAFVMTSMLATGAWAEPPAGKAQGKGGKSEAAKAGEMGKGKGGGMPQMDENSKKMMEAMMKAGTPSEAHKRLAAMTGTWDATVRSWMGPGQPTESKGTAEYKMILDGRFQTLDFNGTFMGKPFQGHGMNGYDNAKKKYVGVWLDNMSTGMLMTESTGTGPGDGKVMEMTAVGTDPMTGKSMTSRSVMRFESDKKHVHEMYDKGPDGKEMKVMEIVYTRK